MLPWQMCVLGSSQAGGHTRGASARGLPCGNLEILIGLLLETVCRFTAYLWSGHGYMHIKEKRSSTSRSSSRCTFVFSRFRVVSPWPVEASIRQRVTAGSGLFEHRAPWPCMEAAANQTEIRHDSRRSHAGGRAHTSRATQDSHALRSERQWRKSRPAGLPATSEFSRICPDWTLLGALSSLASASGNSTQRDHVPGRQFFSSV